MNAAFASQKAEFDRLAPLAKAAETKEADLNKQIAVADKLTRRMEKRILWAPLIEGITATVPRNIQMTKFNCDSGREKSGNSQVNIEGIAADAEPRAIAESFRQSIAGRMAAKYPNATAVFRNLDDSTELAKVNGQRLPTVVFSINVTFKAETDAPAPVLPPKRIAKHEAPIL